MMTYQPPVNLGCRKIIGVPVIPLDVVTIRKSQAVVPEIGKRPGLTEANGRIESISL